MKTSRLTPTITEQIVAFADLKGFHSKICSSLSPEATFEFLSDYYSTAQHAFERSEGRIVKFIGDAILIVLPASDPNDSIVALRGLKTAIDSFLTSGGHDSLLQVKAHIGTLAVGPLGSGELERFDVCGIAVNQAALLPDGEWVLSDELRKRTKA